ncbi:hypothetical protein [Terrarubrum flagellatum]
MRRAPVCDLPQQGCVTEGITMLDVLMLAIAFGCFALTIGYAYACERL